METDTTLLKQVLLWIVGGGGAMVIVYFVFEHSVRLDVLSPMLTRFASIVLAALLASLAFVVTVVLNYTPDPVGWQGWLEGLFAVAFVAVGGSQWLHGAKKLPNG